MLTLNMKRIHCRYGEKKKRKERARKGEERELENRDNLGIKKIWIVKGHSANYGFSCVYGA